MRQPNEYKNLRICLTHENLLKKVLCSRCFYVESMLKLLIDYFCTVASLIKYGACSLVLFGMQWVMQEKQLSAEVLGVEKG